MTFPFCPASEAVVEFLHPHQQSHEQGQFPEEHLLVEVLELEDEELQRQEQGEHRVIGLHHLQYKILHMVNM